MKFRKRCGGKLVRSKLKFVVRKITVAAMLTDWIIGWIFV